MFGHVLMCVRGPNRPVVKLCSPYRRLFFFDITDVIGVDSCVFLIFTTRVGLSQRTKIQSFHVFILPHVSAKIKSTFAGLAGRFGMCVCGKH